MKDERMKKSQSMMENHHNDSGFMSEESYKCFTERIFKRDQYRVYLFKASIALIVRRL